MRQHGGFVRVFIFVGGCSSSRVVLDVGSFDGILLLDVWGRVLGVVEDDGVGIGSEVVHLVVDQGAEASKIPPAVFRPGAAARLRREILVGEPEPAADGGFDVVDHAFPRGLDAEVAPAAVMMGVVFVLIVLIVAVVVAVAVFLVTRPRVAEDVYPLAGDPLAVAFLLCR